MRPSESRRYNPSRAEDHRGYFVLHDYAARRMGGSRVAGLRSWRRTRGQPTVGENQSTGDETNVLLGFLNQRVISSGFFISMGSLL